MEILVVSHKYPPSIGGMQKHCFELVSGLQKRHKVHTIVSSGGKLVFFLTAFAKVKDYLKKHPEIEIIYLNDGLMAFVLSKLLKKRWRPIVMTAHGLDVVFPLGFFQRWVRKNMSKLDGVIAVSKGTLDECINRGIPADKVYLSPNAIEEPQSTELVSEQHLVEGEYLISIGRSVTRKGYSWFIENVLPKIREDLKYVLVGPGLSNPGLWRFLQKLLPTKLFDLICIFAGVPIDELKIHDLLKTRNLQDRVIRLRGIDDDQLKSLIKHSKMFVLPNISVKGDYEGFGLVNLEAIFNGTVVLAANIDGIPSAIIDQKNGFLVASGDANGWVNQIEEILNDPDLEEKKMAFLNYTKDNFNLERMVSDYEKIFQSIIDQAYSSKT